MKKVRDFVFKRFTIGQRTSTHKVGTDGVLLGAWVDVNGATSILDIGTGSGLIALMLAQRTGEHVDIDGIEIQEGDVAQAIENVTASPWKSRVRIIHSAAQQHSGKYDLIVTNPPYFVNSFLPPENKRSTVRHTQSLSFADILETVNRCLTSNGRFAVILPYTEGRQFITLATTYSLFPRRQCLFKSRNEKPVERILCEFSRQPCTPEREELTLYNESGEWSDSYKGLTGEFYLML